MKYCCYLLLLCFLTLSRAAFAQGVGVGTTTPAASAALDVTSTSGGLLLPRMTAAQRAAIASPAQGLFVFQTDGTPGLYYYIGSSWLNLVNSLVPDADGNAGASPTVRVSTLAGSGAIGSADGRPGTAAQFTGPADVAVDNDGNVYVADQNNHSIRKILITNGAVVTLAGGTPGYADGVGTAARFANPTGVAVDNNGNVYVADRDNSCIRKIVVSTGEVTTLAGDRSNRGYSNQSGTRAQFSSPVGVAVNGNGSTVYVADQGNSCIRKIDVSSKAVTILAGGNNTSANPYGYTDGAGTVAQFSDITGITVDRTGATVYVADQLNHSIRKIVVATAVVSTLAGNGTAGSADGTGTAAQFNNPTGVAVDNSGTVYVADQGNHSIRKITAGVVSTLAGNGVMGFVDGAAAAARFNTPIGVATYCGPVRQTNQPGNVYVADTNNNRIRVVE